MFLRGAGFHSPSLLIFPYFQKSRELFTIKPFLINEIRNTSVLSRVRAGSKYHSFSLETNQIYCKQPTLLSLFNSTTRRMATATNESNSKYNYDLIVIGGGSGGLAASKVASKLGKKVCLLDYVKPSPVGTTWGIGGTCVNVGCMPKKLMHQAGLLGEYMDDAPAFGWRFSEERSHDWTSMVQAIQDYIKSLNWGYRVSLREAGVDYFNEFAEFKDRHSVEVVNKKGVRRTLTGDKFIIAVGGRPRYPNIPGAKEYGITSDDIFSLPYNPGKTLCIGASYIALETAGFLSALGIETTVMVRSILLRGFDQQMAEFVGENLSESGVKFLRGWIPTSIEQLEEGKPPRLRVKAKQTDGNGTWEEEFNTVILAIGRDPCTADLKLQNVGVNINEKNGKIITDENEATNIDNIFAVGDVIEDKPELTPVAILAGRLLAMRLYQGSTRLVDYEKVATTIFTPLEYGCIGLSEEESIAKYGSEDIEVYHSHFQALEHTLSKRNENKCYIKLICVKSMNEKVVGLHYIGPNAGEVVQGFVMGFRFGATKVDFDEIIGVHPTTGRNFTELEITKSSGLSALKKGCCG